MFLFSSSTPKPSITSAESDDSSEKGASGNKLLSQSEASNAEVGNSDARLRGADVQACQNTGHKKGPQLQFSDAEASPILRNKNEAKFAAENQSKITKTKLRKQAAKNYRE